MEGRIPVFPPFLFLFFRFTFRLKVCLLVKVPPQSSRVSFGTFGSPTFYSCLKADEAKLNPLALMATFSTGEAATGFPSAAFCWFSCSIICMDIMAMPDPTPTPAPARAQRPRMEKEVYIARLADILIKGRKQRSSVG